MCGFVVLLLVYSPVAFCFYRVTFNKVHDEALKHQAWHRCQIIIEFYSRTSIPVPFNIFHSIVSICQFVLNQIGRYHGNCQVNCCQGLQTGHQADRDGTALSNTGGAAGNATGGDNVSAQGNGDSDQKLLLPDECGLKFMHTPVTT